MPDGHQLARLPSDVEPVQFQAFQLVLREAFATPGKRYCSAQLNYAHFGARSRSYNMT